MAYVYKKETSRERKLANPLTFVHVSKPLMQDKEGNFIVPKDIKGHTFRKERPLDRFIEREIL